MRSIVVCEFGQWKEFGPVVLLVVTVDPKYLFEGLVRSFGLTIAFGVIARSEVELHVEERCEGTKEVSHELRSTVRGYMLRYSVLGEDMFDEEPSQLGGVDLGCRRDEQCHFRESFYNNENGIEFVRKRKSIEMEFQGCSGTGSCLSRP
jgi:hypothetical protein